MSNWKTASRSDLRLRKAVETLLFNHSNLLSFVFDSDQARLRRSVDELLSESKCLSSGEQTLVRMAIDLWSEYPCCHISSVLTDLGSEDFEQVLKTLVFMGPKPVAAVPPFKRQLKTDSF